MHEFSCTRHYRRNRGLARTRLLILIVLGRVFPRRGPAGQSCSGRRLLLRGMQEAGMKISEISRKLRRAEMAVRSRMRRLATETLSPRSGASRKSGLGA
jgi:hypothetical protein